MYKSKQEKIQAEDRQSAYKTVLKQQGLDEILERKRKSLEAIFDAVPVGMLLVNEGMIVNRVNDAIRRMVGKDYLEIINRPVGDALGCVESISREAGCGNSPACHTCLLMKTIKSVLDSGQAIHEIEIHPRLKVGKNEIKPWLCINAKMATIDDRKYVVVAVNDITDRRKVEEKLKETMEMKAQFISTVSHELRTPLACMKEGVTIVLDGLAGKIGDKQRHFLGIAKKNIDRLTELINDVLDFQKLEAARTELNIQPNDIAEIASDVHETMTLAAKKKEINLSHSLEDNLPNSNAIKFTPAGGSVSVSIQHRAEELLIRVSDTGMGIPKEALPKIFERFYRVQRTGQKIQGTGLGLAIVRKIMTMHSGRIEVESELNQGTVFSIFLPLKFKPAPESLSEKDDNFLENTIASD
ncbi:MAG: PAS domain-containing sensor histidine kinase [Planctomycetota bacterium]|jgi:sensor histidine kinase regulating citrate/malate metabolism